MKIYSLVGVSALATVLAVPALAQQSMHRYAVFFKYADSAVKAMTENPQDRSAQEQRPPRVLVASRTLSIYSRPAANLTEWPSPNFQTK